MLKDAASPTSSRGKAKTHTHQKVTVAKRSSSSPRRKRSELVDMDGGREEAVRRVEQSGIVFIDEIDKIAGREGAMRGPDVSREGVQRDLLPIVEGSTVNTKHGTVRTDHILFIAAGRLPHLEALRPIPELQGRFPIRVELEAWTRDDFVRILTEPKNALVTQYVALLATEGVELEHRPTIADRRDRRDRGAGQRAHREHRRPPAPHGDGAAARGDLVRRAGAGAGSSVTIDAAVRAREARGDPGGPGPVALYTLTARRPARSGSLTGTTRHSSRAGAGSAGTTCVDKLIEKAEILLEALPYMRRFRGQDARHQVRRPRDGRTRSCKSGFAQDVVLLKYVGMNPVIVHGGGPQISEMLERLGIESSVRARHAGHRRSDDGSRRDGPRGPINKEIVALINRHGGRAVGLSGKDGDLIVAREAEGAGGDESVTSARSARSSRVNPGIMSNLDAADFIPVIAPVGDRLTADLQHQRRHRRRQDRARAAAPRSSCCSPTSPASTTTTAT